MDGQTNFALGLSSRMSEKLASYENREGLVTFKNALRDLEQSSKDGKVSLEEVANVLEKLQNEYAPILEVSEEQIAEIDNFMLPWKDRKSGYLDINSGLGVQSWAILQAQWHPETVRIVEKSEWELEEFYYGKRREKFL